MALSPLAIALMQAQTQQPPARPGQISPTDTLGAYQLAGNMAEQQYQAQLNQQNALWGGLASVGGAGITGASRIPAIQQAIGKWISPSAAPTAQDLADDAAADAADANIPGVYGPAADLASSAPNLGGWMSDPAFASLLPSSMGGTSVADWSVPSLGLSAADLGGASGAASLGGSVAADMAAAAPAAAAGTDAAAGGGFALADLLPLMFA
jgi:hypothetical protein